MLQAEEASLWKWNLRSSVKKEKAVRGYGRSVLGGGTSVCAGYRLGEWPVEELEKVQGRKGGGTQGEGASSHMTPLPPQ